MFVLVITDFGNDCELEIMCPDEDWADNTILQLKKQMEEQGFINTENGNGFSACDAEGFHIYEVRYEEVD